MAGLQGALIAFYQTSDTAEAVTLRGLIGASGQMWADKVPETVLFPYVSISEPTGTSVASRGKNFSYQIEHVPLQFDVIANGKAVVDSILLALENCYLRYYMTVDNYTHSATLKNFSRNYEDEDTNHGYLQLTFSLEKSPV